MYYKRVLLGKGMLLFPVFRFCWKRMVLGASKLQLRAERVTYKGLRYIRVIKVKIN